MDFEQCECIRCKQFFPKSGLFPIKNVLPKTVLYLCNECTLILAREAILLDILIHRFKTIDVNNTIGYDKDTEEPIKMPPKVINKQYS